MEKDIIAGICGGISVVLVGHPFDTVKTLLQTAPEGYYKSTIDCVKKTYKHEGIRGFYSGIGSPLLGQMLFRAISFASFFHSTKLLQGEKSRPSNSDLLTAGAITGFIISFIETPIDLIKTRMQLQIIESKLKMNNKLQYSSIYGCIKYTIKMHGFKALWQGWSGTAIRNIPANSVFFPVNEMMKRYFADMDNLNDLNAISFEKKLISGATAGLCYWIGTYPLDRIKGQQMGLPFEQRLSWINTVQYIFNKGGGIRQFTYGLLPCAARAIPACAAMFSTVDIVRNYLHRNSFFIT
jgi:solute carrier family 25 carnitine/acylcarnitine transporter 20/29